ncbi:MAG: carboxypeptidase regulatory-like domain-containing protein, partial [Bacteroidetes bacterium]|nr:carboxypeptidase regulatory-like domain-containing protein [Bacteroidota bacterium]
MRKSILFLILITVASSLFLSCRKELNSSVLIPITVKVTYPDYFSVNDAQGAEVSVMNTATKRTYTGVTNQAGEVVFENMIPGNYIVNASRAVSEEEAEQMTPFNQEIFLNGNARDVLFYQTTSPLTIKLQGGQVGGLVFKQIYYTGSRTPLGGSYFSDQFFEIYNNSLDTIYV